MSNTPGTVAIIKTVFEGLVSVIKAIRCRLSCKGCKSDCQQRPTDLEDIPESQAIKNFYTTLKAEIPEHKIVKKASM